MFKAGESYKAKVIEAGFGKSTKDGSPYPYMKFEATSDTGETGNFFWNGNLSTEVKPGKKMSAADMAIKALLTAGFQGAGFEDLNHGILKFMPADITIELEANDKNELRVKWVNTPKKREVYKGAVPNLTGAFAKARQELGLKVEANGWE